MKFFLSTISVFHVSFILVLCFLNYSAANDFDGCDHVYNLYSQISYLESPNYPSYYPTGTSCRYKFIAPAGYIVNVTCSINMYQEWNDCCSECFYIDREGDLYLKDSEVFCGYRTITRTSLFRSVVLAYRSEVSQGKFQCQLRIESQQCDCGWSVNTKIVNGQNASINGYPSMVALKDITRQPAFFCAASIISSRFLLTAAHCVATQPNPAYLEAWVGRHNLQSDVDTKYAAVYYIEEIIAHPNYIPEPTNNDIALLKTSQYIDFSRGVGPICLPPTSNTNNGFVNNYVDVIGWGTTKFAGAVSSTLQYIELLVLSSETCKNIYGDENIIYPSQICTYDYMNKGKDSCQFDSGGPVIFIGNRQFLVGIISFGGACGIGKYAVGVNTRITSYLNWIYYHIGYTSTCSKPI